MNIKSLIQNFKNFLSRRFRWIFYTKRYLVALYDHLSPVRNTYSQRGEDKFIEDQLQGLDLRSGVYIDVGANQPSRFSNTYLFYRKGLRGILVEPDNVNFYLLYLFRGRDTVIKTLAGSTSQLMEFNRSIYPSIGSVKPIEDAFLLKTEYIPQTTVDEITKRINPDWIYLLSIDTEGYDLEVLKGSKETFKKTLIVCVEYHGNEELSSLCQFMGENSFDMVLNNGLNLVFRNNVLLI